MKNWRSNLLLGICIVVASAKVLCQTKLKVACMGNSVTFGLGHKTPSQTAYPVVLQKLLGDGYDVRNFGHSGATLLKQGHNPYYKTAAFQQAIQYVPDVAIIDLGLNDTDPRNWPNHRDAFAADYSWLIDTLRSVNGAMQIYICKMTPVLPDHPGFLSGTRDWFWEIQNQLPVIAKSNKVTLVDIHQPLYQRPDLFVDALHPDEAGANIIATTIYQQLSGDYGGLQLAGIFGSDMVLQRNQPIKFYGSADKNEKIEVHFNGRKQTTITNAKGKWLVTFPAMAAGGPYHAIVSSSSKKIELQDLLVGEVWLCSGQSNMAFPLGASINGEEEITTAHNKKDLRLFQMKPIAGTDNTSWDSITLGKINQLEYFKGNWQRADSSNAK
ncbi:MAG: sialate O-acetylesterase, partial [Chitinophagaceae bacterium]